MERPKQGLSLVYPCRWAAGDPNGWGAEDWFDFPAAGPFILAGGNGKAQLQTWARAVWTHAALHLMFWCEDPEPWATMTGHDENLYEEEVVEAFIAPGEDRTSYFEFEINPLGALFDAAIRWYGWNAIEVRREWDCAGLAGGACTGPDGWRAWLTIPFSGIGAHPAPGDEWAINLYRIERRPRLEFSSWSPLFTHPPQYHSPARFGLMRFMVD